MSEIRRSIKFYRFNLGFENKKPIQLDIASLTSSLSKLKGQQRVLVAQDGVQHICTPISSSKPNRLRFLRIKNTDLPKIVDKDFKEEDLEPGKGIGEAVHVVLFPGNIIGVEYNKNGSSMYWINDYLSSMC